MTILEIEILLHYACTPEDYRGGDFSAPAVRETIDSFRDDLNLLRHPTEEEKRQMRYSRCYMLTERGEVYVQALKNVPLPVQVWVMPEAEAA